MRAERDWGQVSLKSFVFWPVGKEQEGVRGKGGDEVGLESFIYNLCEVRLLLSLTLGRPTGPQTGVDQLYLGW